MPATSSSPAAPPSTPAWGAPAVDWLPEMNKFPRLIMSTKYLSEQYGPMLTSNKAIFGN